VIEFRQLLGRRCQVLAQPRGDPRFVPVACRDRKHSALGVVHVRHRFPSPTVEFDEQPERHPRGSFVSVWQRVVPGKPHDQYRRLVDKVGTG
jgi:hypothetical protein